MLFAWLKEVFGDILEAYFIGIDTGSILAISKYFN